MLLTKLEDTRKSVKGFNGLPLDLKGKYFHY